MSLDSTKVISGSFGKCYHDGEWMTNITNVELTAEISKEEIKRAGTRTIGHKVTTITYSGTISGYKVTNTLAKKIAQVTNDSNKSFVTEIIANIDDPDAPEGKTKVRIKGVQFDSIPILGFEAGAIIEEEYPFTASGYEYL
ncbi:phage tail tube protein [Neobacillus mesonae]|uniref:Phage portal protein n=1 Tax=Neobacillus mesonae TaxID=1193713 RepID=A0A3Q9QQZ0_9BACI|nr:phage tail tube protein [Neobacillus mesonae]AZU61074.1 phage portal protein [Neobacillus mesonae]